jgi:hypothetical protein
MLGGNFTPVVFDVQASAKGRPGTDIKGRTHNECDASSAAGAPLSIRHLPAEASLGEAGDGLAASSQTASVQLSEKASADVEKGRPSRSRGQDRPFASTPLRTRRVPSAGINTVHTP